MEEILEMSENNQLTLPSTLVETLNLEPGAHFVARAERGSLVIEYTPFSSIKQGEMLEETIESMHEKRRI